jgi:hypothetical protein
VKPNCSVLPNASALAASLCSGAYVRRRGPEAQSARLASCVADWGSIDRRREGRSCGSRGLRGAGRIVSCLPSRTTISRSRRGTVIGGRWLASQLSSRSSLSWRGESPSPKAGTSAAHLLNGDKYYERRLGIEMCRPENTEEKEQKEHARVAQQEVEQKATAEKEAHQKAEQEAEHQKEEENGRKRKRNNEPNTRKKERNAKRRNGNRSRPKPTSTPNSNAANAKPSSGPQERRSNQARRRTGEPRL